jgi:sugar phosphate isomerase/epimerase
MKYGAMNFPIAPLVDEIAELGQLGFDYVEISMDPPEALPQEVRQLKGKISSVVNRYGIGLMAHMPTFLSTADLYESLRRASVDETVAALEIASELGISKVVLHPPYVTGLGKFVPNRVKEYALSSLGEIIEKAERLTLTVCLENLFDGAGAFTTPREFETIWERFPNVNLTLDIGHAFLSGGIENALEFIQAFGKRIRHVHVNDNFGKEDSHLPLGVGLIDFRRILKELHGSGYDDTMTLEVFSRDRDYLRLSRDKLRDLWEEVA